jgi:low temperature requirement protein LtrA
MWWVYFIGDHHSQGERVLDETSPESRAQKGRWTYSVAHLILIAGLVLTAAGLHEVVHGPTRHLSLAGASTLASGVVLFLAGLVTFVRSLGIASGGHLLIAAAASVPTIALGTLINGAVQLAALALVLIALSVRANSATA